MDKLLDSGATPLFNASQKRHLLIVEVLITGKANLEKTNDSCETLLLIASKNGHLLFVEVLIVEKANLEKENDSGETRVFIALQKRNLLIGKAHFNQVQTTKGCSPLVLARFQ